MRAGLLAALTALLTLATGFSGCSDDGAQDQAVDEGPRLITDPNDFSALLNASDNQPHLHDYWGGKDRVLVLDGGLDDVGPGFSMPAGNLSVQEFRPESGYVVPLGTSEVVVEFSWEDEDGDLYNAPELWVKTAADNATRKVADLENGATVTVPSTNERNDLPHQRLSAWVFELRMHADPTTGILRFKGTTSIHAEAVRGLDIPVFPAHPDLWNGAHTIPVLEATAFQAYMSDPGDGGCDGVSCRLTHVPDDGVLVPYDAKWVDVTLSFSTASPTALGLAYHGADTRGLARPTPLVDPDGTQHYRIPVEPVNADGPYALQSQWAFEAVVTGPVPDTVAVQEYTITVSVTRLP